MRVRASAHRHARQPRNSIGVRNYAATNQRTAIVMDRNHECVQCDRRWVQRNGKRTRGKRKEAKTNKKKLITIVSNDLDWAQRPGRINETIYVAMLRSREMENRKSVTGKSANESVHAHFCCYSAHVSCPPSHFPMDCNDSHCTAIDLVSSIFGHFVFRINFCRSPFTRTCVWLITFPKMETEVDSREKREHGYYAGVCISMVAIGTRKHWHNYANITTTRYRGVSTSWSISDSAIHCHCWNVDAHRPNRTLNGVGRCVAPATWIIKFNL